MKLTLIGTSNIELDITVDNYPNVATHITAKENGIVMLQLVVAKLYDMPQITKINGKIMPFFEKTVKEMLNLAEHQYPNAAIEDWIARYMSNYCHETIKMVHDILTYRGVDLQACGSDLKAHIANYGFFAIEECLLSQIPYIDFEDTIYSVGHLPLELPEGTAFETHVRCRYE